MTTGPRPPPETIGYRRSTSLPGIEVLDAANSPREWRAVSPDFAVTLLRTWRGEVLYQGRKHPVEPGIAFCNHPDEALVATPNQGLAGSFSVLVVDPEVFKQWIAETQRPALRAHWCAITKPISLSLQAKAQHFLSMFGPEAQPLELQADIAELSASLIHELVTGAGDATLNDGPPIRGTARMRECLTEAGFDIDLDSLAKEAGLGRFQALRAFKRRYGLPPHAYQMCVRISLARRLLLEGAATADVALRCGFVDQSHLTRHFKRVTGVTPKQYARAHAASKDRSSGTYPVQGAIKQDTQAAVISRSDHSRSR